MRTSSKRDLIVDALREAGSRGMTCEELEKPSGLSAGLLTAYLARYESEKLVRRLPEKRKNSLGRSIIIWAICSSESAPETDAPTRAFPGKQREKILAVLRAAGATGMICEELAEHVDINVNKLPSYLSRLEGLGIARSLPTKRKNRAGHVSKAWVLVGEPEVTADSRPGDFWADIRKRVASYVKDKSENMSAVVFEQVFRDFEVDMQDLVKSFQNRLKQRQRDHLVPEVVSRKAVFAACRTLQVDPPKIGAPVDDAAAKRNKRQMVRAYHPDAFGVNNDATRDMYEAVIAAYETIAQYNDSLRRKNVT